MLQRLCTFAFPMKKKILPYRDPFGYPIWAKRTVIFWFGMVTWYRCNRLNSLKVSGESIWQLCQTKTCSS